MCRRLRSANEEASRRCRIDDVPAFTVCHAAQRMYEGAGLGPKDVQVLSPYDGYAPMAQFFLEASVTMSNVAMRSPAISGSRDRIRCARATATWGTGAPA